MTKELTIYAWDFESVETAIMAEIYDKINFLWFQEFQLSLPQIAVDHINSNNIRIRVVTCASFVEEIINSIEENGINLELIESVESWPGFWFMNSHDEMIKNANKIYFDINKNQYPMSFKYPFLTFNGRSRQHRTLLIDKLIELNLIDKGIVTYHCQFEEVDHADLNYYDGSPIIIDDAYPAESSFRFNEKYVESFLHIPTESTLNMHLISEKTAMPILCKQPFLTLGPVNYHARLKELGFKLYDEIFDYSFDSEPDLNLRIEKLLKNVQSVVAKANKLNFLYSTIKDKIEFNRELAIELMSDRSKIPALMIERYENKIPASPVPDSWDRKFVNFKEYTDQPLVFFQNDIYYCDLWRDFSYEKVVEDIKTYNPKTVMLCGENEWEPWYSEEFVKLINERSIEFIHVTGVVDCTFVRKSFEVFGNNIKPTFWPTFWFNNVLAALAKKEFEEYQPNKNFKYPFISLNNRAHTHRCQFIDSVAKHNLFDKGGIITWVDLLNEQQVFDFKYYNKEIKLLDDDFINKKDSFLIPDEWHQSFFDCVVEASHQAIVISEKTLKPLLHKKPFFCLSAPGFHKYLQELGFELYDEFIDYSFDEEENLEIRAEKFALNLKNLLSIKNLSAAYDSIQHKIEKNYRRVFEIKNDLNFIPDPVRQIILSTPPKNNLILYPQLKYRELTKKR